MQKFVIKKVKPCQVIIIMFEVLQKAYIYIYIQFLYILCNLR